MREFLKFKGVLAGFHAVDPDVSTPELTHAGEAWVPNDYQIGWHRHDVWEFYFQIEGATNWRSRGKSYRIGPGSLLAVAPNVPHSLIDPAKIQHHYFYAGIDLEAMFRHLPELRKIFRPGQILQRDHAEELAGTFRQLLREVSLDMPFRSDGLRLTAEMLVVEIARVLANAPSRSFVAMHPGVRRAQELIDQRPAEQWQTGMLARMSGLSISRFNECFRAELGTSPHKYLLHRRLHLAGQLLRQIDRSITDVALDLGFSSSQHFALAFRKQFGVSARYYRNRKPGRKRR